MNALLAVKRGYGDSRARRLGFYGGIVLAAAFLPLSLAGSASRRRPADRGRWRLDRHRAGRRGGRRAWMPAWDTPAA